VTDPRTPRASTQFDDMVDPDRDSTRLLPSEGAHASRADAAFSDDPMAHPAMADRTMTDPAMSDPAMSDPAMSDPAMADPAMDDRAVAGDPALAADPAADRTNWAASEAPADTSPAGTPAATDLQAGSSAKDEDRWRELQARFVDEPESVTREAATMVDQAVTRLTKTLAAAGGDGSTESLRTAFRRYREVYRMLVDA
jgi:hypothetical protein